MTPRVESTLSLTFAEILDGYFSSWSRRIFGVLLVVMLGHLGWRASLAPPEVRGGLYAQLVLLALAVAFTLLWRPLLTWRRVRSLERTFAAGEEGLEVRGTETEFVPWDFFTWYRETPLGFLLWRKGTTSATYLPKRAFLKAEDLAWVRQVLRVQVGAKSRS